MQEVWHNKNIKSWLKHCQPNTFVLATLDPDESRLAAAAHIAASAA